jgi:hypothetical protein
VAAAAERLTDGLKIWLMEDGLYGGGEKKNKNKRKQNAKRKN